MPLQVRRSGPNAVFEVFDYIGGFGVTAADVAQAISETSGTIEVLIASGGGDAVDGLAIYNLLRNVHDRVTTKNIALAGSAASLIFAAGARRIAAKASVTLMHRASGGDSGNSEDLQSRADALAAFDTALTAAYVQATGQTEKYIRKLIDTDAWLTAAEILDLGLATELEDLAMTACVQLRPVKDRVTQRDMDIRTLLGLKPEATDAEVEAEVTRLKAPPKQTVAEPVDVASAVTKAVAEAFATREALMALQAGPRESEQQLELAATALVERAIKAGKILPAQRKQAIAVAAKSQLALDSASSLWADSPAIVNREKVAPGAVPNADAIVLDAQQKRMCAASGIKEEDFVAQMKRDAERRATRPAREEG